jgi:tRNA(fMet)-specific endonuclease VapC
VTDKYLLDTNIVTAILKKDHQVFNRLQVKLAANAHILISAVVYYEIKRGLLKRNAVHQLAVFEEMVRSLEWADVERSHWETAAILWAECQKAGVAINDADLLLAAQARQAQAVLVTDDADFSRLDVLRENWIVRPQA